MKTYPHRQTERGSILIAAIIFTAIASILLGSYLKMANTELRISDINFTRSALINVAEAGVEEAIYALKYDDLSHWTERSSDIYVYDNSTGSSYSNYFWLGAGRSAHFNVILDLSGPQPVVYAEAEGVMSNNRTTTRQIKIELEDRSFFAMGLVAKNGVTFKGNNVTVDSYNSSKGAYNSLTNRNDNGFVGSVSVTTDIISLSNSDVWGKIATGGSNKPSFGPNGSLKGYDTAIGVDIDWDRWTSDFSMNFPDVTPPTLNSPNTSLPPGNTKTIGNISGTPSVEYNLSDTSLSTKETLVIQGEVVMIIDGDLSVKGEIRVEGNGKLELYISGDASIGGNGAVNVTNVPEAIQIYGTSTTSQTFTISGNADLYAAIYAPYADIELKGGGSTGAVGGSIIGNDLFINGNYDFHYDEDLSDLMSGEPSWKMKSWVELTTTDERIDFDTYPN